MDLNTILIILGVLALIALIAHGIWSRRREKSQYFDNAKHFSREPVPSFSSQVQSKPAVSSAEMPSMPTTNTTAVQNAYATESQAATPATSVEQIKIVLPNQPKNQQFTASSVPNIQYGEPDVTAETQTAPTLEQSSFSMQNHNEMPVEQLIVTTSMPQMPLVEPVSTAKSPDTYTYQEKTQEAAEYITLYVVAPENRQFQGAKLMAALEELGFIFGKGHLFHYHLHLSIDGPVLFSVADVNESGAFNPHRLAESATIGVALFMPLPSVGNTLANLKMMIRAARTLAEQLDGFVLTDEQEIFTEQAEQAYLRRV